MKNLIIISFLFLIVSCSDTHDHINQNEPELVGAIDGAWISNDTDSSSFFANYSLNFEDSLLFLFTFHNSSLNFSIKDSILTVTPKNSTKNQDLKILEVSSNSLKLLMLPGKWIGFRKEIDRLENDTLYFSRITKKNNLKPVRISFSSTTCFGPCPSLELEIDQNRDVKFYGNSFTDLEGGYSGRMPQYIYDRIINQIRAIPMDSLKSRYSAPYTCAQTCYLRLTMEDTIINVSSYGNYQQPDELPIVYGTLMDLYKQINLTKDSTLNRPSFSQSVD